MEPLDAADPARIGPYVLLGRLGSGGMGTVYLGRSGRGRTVAVKVVHRHLAGESDFRARFAREVNAARHVSGAFTASVVDADTDAEVPWMATTFVPGLALSRAVAAHGPLPDGALRMLIGGIAEALRGIHAVGLVHRDLKPGNVLLALDGPHVIDFGITRTPQGQSLTNAGSVMGTLGYMSPEQARELPLDARSDTFSLGATAYYAATGSPPFGEGLPSLHRVIADEPDAAALPEGPVGALILGCLAKDPAARPTPEQVVDFIARNAAEHAVPVGAGSWLPAEVTADIVAVRQAALRPPPADAREGIEDTSGGPQSGPLSGPASGPVSGPLPPPPAHPPQPPPPTGQRFDLTPPVGHPQPGGPTPEPSRTARGLTRRRVIIGAAAAAVTAGIGTTAALLGSGSDGNDTPESGSKSGPANGGSRPQAGTHRVLLSAPEATPRLTATLDIEVQALIHGGDDVLIAFAMHQLAGLDHSGRLRWGPLRFTAGMAGMVTPGLVHKGVLYAAGLYTPEGSRNLKTELHAIEVATGKVLWSLPVPDPSWTTRIVHGVVGNTVFVTGPAGRGAGPYTGFIWAVDIATRRELWRTTGPELASLVVVPRTGRWLLAGTTTGIDGEITAIDAATGQRGWHRSVPNAPFLGGLTGAAVGCEAAGNLVVAGSKVIATNAETGAQAWEFVPPSATETFGHPLASEDGKTVFAFGLSGLYALDAATGEGKWRSAPESGALGGIGMARAVVADGNLYLPDGKSNLWAIDPRTGNGRWRHNDPRNDTFFSTARAYGSGKVWIALNRALTVFDVTGK